MTRMLLEIQRPPSRRKKTMFLMLEIKKLLKVRKREAVILLDREFMSILEGEYLGVVRSSGC